MMFFVSSQAILCISLIHVAFTSPAPPFRPRVRADHLDVTPANNGFACVRWPTWVSRDFVKEDCYSAIQHLYAQEVMPHGDQKYPVTGRTTPKRYVAKSCTVVLLMLFKFNPYELPGRLPHGRSIADIVTFHQVYDAATNLERHCIGPGGSGQAGWQPVGDVNSIGVFLWATDSEVNGDPRFPHTHMGLEPNTSSIFLASPGSDERLAS